MVKAKKHSNPSTISSEDNEIFYVSASQLTMFYQCPARYAFSRRLASRKPDPYWIRDGLAAHKLVSGLEFDGRISPRALRMVERLVAHTDKNYKIHSTETIQSLPILRQINLLRTIDAIAEDDKGGVLIDYKFTGKGWDVIPELNIAPKAAGFQAKAYLLPPVDPDPYETWPTRIHFIVITDDDLEVHEYNARTEDKKEIIAAAQLMKQAWDAHRLPKVEGYLCHSYCQYRAPCFGEKDWEADYDTIDNQPYKADIRYQDD